MLTLISNRVGDVLIIRGAALIFTTGRLNFTALASALESLPVRAMWLFIIAACTKRAQIPFSAWLPAAMAAPTPVRALVHSSTLVTAGVYLSIRLDILLTRRNRRYVLFYLGVLTIFLARRTALFEYDIKKIIALSTLSQLGLMITCLGLRLPELAYFHILTHAFFKSLLFMATGSLMHSVGSAQDLRGISLSAGHLPVTSGLLLTRNLSLMGLPFLRGFYSKDAFLESALSLGAQGLGAFILFFLRTGFTALYTMRFIHLVFCGSKSGPALL